MGGTSAKKDSSSVIVFHYNGSPYARKLTLYLRLLGQDYAECIQPAIMPRPDLAALGVNYRRIPIVSIDGQIFCDTHLIFKELERKFGTNGCLGEVGKSAEMQKMEDGWENWADALFLDSVLKTMPKSVEKMMPAGFWADRRAFAGGILQGDSKEALLARKRGLSGVKSAFEHLEYEVLKDGRRFIAGTDSPTLSDLKCYWVLEFAGILPGVLAEAGVDFQTFPKTLAWMDRFRTFVKKAPNVQVKKVTGGEAKDMILAQSKTLGNGGVAIAFDENNKFGLGFRARVEVVPSDTGRTHPQQGELIGLNRERFSLETKTEDGQPLIVHFPVRHYEITELSTPRNNSKL